MPTEHERERAAVYMDGLAQMRSEWRRGHRTGMKKGKSKKGEGRREKGEGRR
jgi:hypothetical protein